MVQRLARVEDECQRSIHRTQIQPENTNFRTVPDSYMTRHDRHLRNIFLNDPPSKPLRPRS